VTVALLAAAVMIAWSLGPLSGGVFRDHADVLAVAFGSPIVLAFPLIFLLPAIGLVAAPITNRFVTQLWPRRSMRVTLAQWAARVAGLALVTTSMSFGIVTVFVMVFSAQMFPEAINSAAYDMTPSQALADLLNRFNFGPFGALGYVAFAIMFILFVSLQSAIYALLALGCAVRWGRPVLAVFVPIALYMGVTVILAILGQPSFAPLYTVAPFGLVRTGEWQPLSGLAVIVAITAAIWAPILSDPRRAEALA
jgi:hypothetical protein